MAALLLSAVLTAQAGAPTAEAGLPLLAEPGNVVILNGSASEDPDGDPLAFTWIQISGPTVELAKADSDSPEFTVPEGGTYRFELIVSDGEDESDPDIVEVIAPYMVIEDGYDGCAHGGNQRDQGALIGIGIGLGLVMRARRQAR